MLISSGLPQPGSARFMHPGRIRSYTKSIYLGFGPDRCWLFSQQCTAMHGCIDLAVRACAFCEAAYVCVVFPMPAASMLYYMYIAPRVLHFSAFHYLLQVVGGDVTIFDRVQGYDLAPSKLKRKEVLSVAECILEAKLHQAMDLRDYVFGKSLTAFREQTLTNTYDMTAVTTMVNHHKTMTMHVTEEEAAGYAMLAIYAVHFATVLSGELKKDFKYYSQFQVADNLRAGQNPTTDTAIIMLATSQQCIPTVMYEYKPTVHTDPSRVDVLALMEVFLQAYYCIRYYKIQVVLHCLTDLKTWHYFKIALNKKTSRLNIAWSHRIEQEDQLSEDHLAEHSKFILHEATKFCCDSET